MAAFAMPCEGFNQLLIVHGQLRMFPDEGPPVISFAPMTCPVQAVLGL